MATLKDFFTGQSDGITLKYLIDRYKLTTLIETGAGKGESLEYCKGHFDKVLSIEIMPQLVKLCEQKFINDPNVLVMEGTLPDDLGVLLDLFPIRGNCMFFHDAHFPGADFHYTEYDTYKNEDRMRLPLEGELQIVRDKRDFSGDVFIIDDLWLYEEGPFGAGNCTVHEELRKMGCDFIYKMFEKSHHVWKDYRYQGFLLIVPK